MQTHERRRPAERSTRHAVRSRLPRSVTASVAAALTTVTLCGGGTTLAPASDMSTPSTSFFDVIRARHSVRAYEPRSVEHALLDRILEAARAAPSAGNAQGYAIVVVEDGSRRSQLAQAALGQRYVAEAPVVLVFVTDPARSEARYGSRGAELYCLQDAAIAATHAQLAATALGLGSVWVGAFDEAKVLEIVGASSPHRAVSMLVIGHAAEKPRATPRRPLSELVKRESFAIPWTR